MKRKKEEESGGRLFEVELRGREGGLPALSHPEAGGSSPTLRIFSVVVTPRLLLTRWHQRSACSRNLWEGSSQTLAGPEGKRRVRPLSSVLCSLRSSIWRLWGPAFHV